MKTKADKSARNDKKQAEALARTQKALEQKTFRWRNSPGRWKN